MAVQPCELPRYVGPYARLTSYLDNASPYSSGNTGASLTSTAVAPMTETDVALFDEEELMYDDIQLVKKEKDRAKKRAYVRMVTNLGGSLNIELFCEKVRYLMIPGLWQIYRDFLFEGSENLLQFLDASTAREI